MEIPSGTILKDRYRVQEKLAAGGMGAVYLAHDSALDTLVAIKANINPSQHSTDQFLREAKLLAALRHQNLPRVTDHFVIDDMQYLVMDYIPGDDLSERLANKGPQPLVNVIDWGVQLSQALTYLHTQDSPIIHRDIKPSNVKLTPQGNIILVDFGIAKSVDGGNTATGARGLTPGYAPPEQYGSGKTSPATDQYALAATLYTLLTGTEPAEAVERMLGNQQLRTLAELDASIPAHVDAAIQRALAIQPENRFTSVAEFMAAMGNPNYVNQAETIPAHIDAQPEIKTRSRAPLVITLLVVLAVGAYATYSFFGAASSESESTPSAVANSSQLTAAAQALLPTDASAPDATATPIPAASTAENTPTATAIPTPKGGGPLIAFVSNRGDGRTFQVLTMRPDGSDVVQVTFSEGNKSNPTWSPDGKQLLFVGNGGRDNFGNDLGLDIWAMDADGSNLQNLTQNIGDDYEPAWSPDGTKIVFTTTRVEATNGLPQLFIMNADGSEQTFITRGYGAESSPNWSPDGEFIAFEISFRSGPPVLFLRNGEGEEPRAFDFNLGKRVGEINDPEWSPDGLTIVYTCVGSIQYEICLTVVASNGTEIFELTNTLGNKEPSFSPDGLWIVFTSTRDQNSEIYIMDSLGRNQVNISNHDSIDREANWQPQPTP